MVLAWNGIKISKIKARIKIQWEKGIQHAAKLSAIEYIRH